MQTPEARHRMARRDSTSSGSSSEEFLRFVQAESEKLGKVIRDNGIKVE